MMTAARVAGRVHYNKKRVTTTCKRSKHQNQLLPCSKSSVTVSITPGPGESEPSSARESSSNSRSHNSLTVSDEPPVRKRSGSVPGHKILTLALAWSLKSVHIRALKATWPRLCEPPRSHCKGIVALVERVWEKLDSKDRNVREIFYRAAFVDSMNESKQRCTNSMATLRDHTHFFVSLVSQIVQNLECEPTEIFMHIDKIGLSHAYLKQYGFKYTHWEKVGEYFVDAVVVQDCVRAFPEACKAWTLLVAALVDRLRAATPRRGSFGHSQQNEEVQLQPTVRFFGAGSVLCPSPSTHNPPRQSIDLGTSACPFPNMKSFSNDLPLLNSS